MTSREWQRAQRRTTVRRVSKVLVLASLFLTVLLGALAASPAWPAASAADTRSSADSRRREACALIVGPAKAYCERKPKPAIARESQVTARGAWVLLPPAAALLALAGLRRWGKPGRP